MSKISLVAILALSFVACGVAEKPPIVPDRVILITIDTLRADHMASFGYPIDTAPFIDELARQGTSFKRAYAHSSTTGPSHSSMFTALYPIQHRVRDNRSILDPSFVTLAETLTEAGFRTAAFVSGMAHFGNSKIAQGFQHYNQPVEEEMQNEQGESIPYRRAELTTDLAIEWLSDVGADERFFLWVHYYDPHNPLSTGAPYLDRATPAEGAPREEFLGFLEETHKSDFERDDVLRNIHKYDAEIMYLDEQVARLFGTYGDLGLDPESLWILTSDHGQGLANHDHWGHHVQIYNVHLHVPLIFYASDGSLAQGEIDGQIAEHVDIPATILDLLGLELSGQTAPLQGKSLVPILSGDRSYRHKPYSFAERRRFRGNNAPLREPGERFALQTLRYKYIWFSEGEDEFYDLVDDPYESANLIDEPIPEKDDLRLALERLISTLEEGGEAEQIIDEETLRRLRSLGYIQ